MQKNVILSVQLPSEKNLKLKKFAPFAYPFYISSLLKSSKKFENV